MVVVAAWIGLLNLTSAAFNVTSDDANVRIGTVIPPKSAVLPGNSQLFTVQVIRSETVPTNPGTTVKVELHVVNNPNNVDVEITGGNVQGHPDQCNVTFTEPSRFIENCQWTVTIGNSSTTGAVNLRTAIIDEPRGVRRGIPSELVYPYLTVSKPDFTQPPLATLSCNVQPNCTIPPNNSGALLIWSATNAYSCRMSSPGLDLSDWTGTSNMKSTGILSKTTTYNLECKGPGGNTRPSYTVIVRR